LRKNARRVRETSRRSILQAEIEAAAAQFGEIARDRAVFGVELHPHRHHLIRSGEMGIPDLALFVGAAIGILPTGKADNVLSADVTDTRRTGKALTALRRQGFRLGISEAQVITT